MIVQYFYYSHNEAVLTELEDLRFHMVLGGLADINQALDRTNAALQPLGVNACAA